MSFGRNFFADTIQAEPSTFHRQFVPELESIRDRRGVRLNRIGYRGCAKTTWLMIHIAQCAAYQKERYIIILKNTLKQAKKDLVPLANAFHGPLGNAFGIQIRSLAADHLELSNGVRIEVYGLDQELHGIKYGHHRPGLIICDDIQGVADIHSPVYRQNSKDKFQHMVLPLGTPDTNIIVVGNALHREAIVCENQTSGGWESGSYPAILQDPLRMDLWNEFRNILLDYTRDDPKADSLAFYVENRAAMDEGAVVDWPERFSLVYLMTQRYTTSLAAFNAQWQNNPHDPTLSEWPQEDDDLTGVRSYFDWDGFFYKEKDYPAKEIKLRTMGVDPSMGRSDKTGDFQGIVKISVANNGTKFVDAILGRQNVEAFADTFVREVRDFQPHVVYFEVNQWQGLLKAPIQARAKTFSPPVKLSMIREVDNTENKQMRIRRLGDGLAARKFRFKAGTKGTAMTIEQAKDFPNGRYDDGLDAWEMADRAANKPTEIAMGGGGW